MRRDPPAPPHRCRTLSPQRRDALKAELAQLERQLAAANRSPVDPATPIAAIEQAERDRDALTSPAVESLRETVEDLCTDLERTWSGCTQVIINAEQVAQKEPSVRQPPSLLPATEAVIQAHDHTTARLAAAHIDYLNLPQIPSHPQLGTGEHR